MRVTQPASTVVDARSAADADVLSVIQLIRQLVRTPSRAGEDPPEPILATLEDWLGERGVIPRRLGDESGATVALVCDVAGGQPGPRYLADACVDTAPFGDEAAWTYPPTSGEIAEGWLYGRGSADSKAGAAIFAHLAVRLAHEASSLRGSLSVLFDADEHTGRFSGASTYFAGPEAPDDIAGVMIGYPGHRHLVIGGRGVLRVRLDVYGVGSHSGGQTATPNAVSKAGELVGELSRLALPDAVTDEFPLPPKLTVTAIRGGQGYSVTPERCSLNVDARLTPSYTVETAAATIRRAARDIDARWPDTKRTVVTQEQHWPPFRLGSDSRLSTILLNAARGVGLQLEPKVAGPSNIGNYLAGLGIEATAGFGVEYRNVHAANECIRLDTIAPVQATYHRAIRMLLS